MSKRPEWLTETADLVQYVSGPLEGSLADWPSNIQDQIAAQLEILNRGRAAKHLGLYKINGSRSDLNPDTGRWFAHVVAQAITLPPGAGPLHDAPARIQ